MRQTVVFDFDGVIHSYTSGWQGETCIPDPPVAGIQEAIHSIHEAGYEVVIVSTRCSTLRGRMAIESWLDMYQMTQDVDRVCKEKPPAIVYIDDRAICFDGHPESLLGKIKAFEPWNKKARTRKTIIAINDSELLDEVRTYIQAHDFWIRGLVMELARRYELRLTAPPKEDA